MGVSTGMTLSGAKTRRRAGKKQSEADAAFRWRPLAEPPAPEIDLGAAAAGKRAINHERAFPDLEPRRMRLEPAIAVRLLVLGDWTLLAFAFSAAARIGFETPLTMLTLGAAIAIAAPLALLKLGLWLVSAYQSGHVQHAERALGGLALGAIAGLVAAAFAPDARAAAALAAIIPPAAIAMTALHALISFFVQRSARAGVYAETAIVVGATDAARRFIARARETGRLHIVAIVDDRAARSPARVEGVPVAGGVDALLSWPQLPEIDRIIVSVGAHAEARAKALIERLRVLPNRVDLLVDLERVGHVDRRFDGAASVACVSGVFTRPVRAFMKRACDIAVGAALALLFAPAMLVIAIAVACDSPGPILFRQRRHGFNNRVFDVWKFRTMKHGPAEKKVREVTADDPRVTRVGRVLRRMSLDELPQIWNVLKGDMSLVGPRPHPVGMRAAETELTRIAADYAHRHRMRPGVTGWAQINGSRGPMTTAEAVRERVRLDLEYVAHASVWLDLWILLRTIPALFGDRGQR